jgi:hypothetical protein
MPLFFAALLLCVVCGVWWCVWVVCGMGAQDRDGIGPCDEVVYFTDAMDRWLQAFTDEELNEKFGRLVSFVKQTELAYGIHANNSNSSSSSSSESDKKASADDNNNAAPVHPDQRLDPGMRIIVLAV